MSNLDDLAKVAEEAEAANVHDRPVTDADLGETAAEGAQVVVDGGVVPTPVVTPAPVAAQPIPEMQLPEPVAAPTEPTPAAPVAQNPMITIQSPEVAPAPLPQGEKPPQLTPFSDQITTDTAPTQVMQTAQPASMQPMQPISNQPMQSAQPMAEQPSAPPAAGTMPGQTVSPQTVATTPSHIIPESFPKPATGIDPLSGIAV